MILTSEVMLHQTQVARAEVVWPGFVAEFPTPQATAAAGPAAVIRAWGRLGYPRRARHLYDTAVLIASDGWPDDLRGTIVVVRGTLTSTKLIPSPVRAADGAVSQGAEGEQWVLDQWTVEPVK